MVGEHCMRGGGQVAVAAVAGGVAVAVAVTGVVSLSS